MANIFKFPELRKKIIFTLFVIIVFRLLAHIPVPGVNTEAIRNFIQSNALLGMFNVFSGGGFQNFSIVTLGLNPYINSSIILQLFTMMIPSLEQMQKEPDGREKINMYTKLLTVPLSFMQAYGMYFLLNQSGVINTLNAMQLAILVLTFSAGTMLLVWIGDLVTEHGVGNGISLLIFVGIISQLPASMAQFVSTVSSDTIFDNLLFIALTLLIIAAVVMINEGTRNIPIEYGRVSVRSQRVTNYLPIKVNQVGVIPIIFAVSIVMIPSLISGPLQSSSNATAQNIGTFLALNFQQTSLWYNVLYFFLVFGFTYFYTSIQFNPEKIADDIKKRGGFIPGIRPGLSTKRYLGTVISRITLVGGIFLGLIAIMPYLLQVFGGFQNFTVGGTSLLIVVSVVLETIRQVKSLMVTRSYQNFLD